MYQPEANRATVVGAAANAGGVERLSGRPPGQQNAANPQPVESLQVEQRLRAGPVVEKAASSAQDRFAAAPDCPRERQAGREVVIVVREVLPIVPQAGRDRQVAADPVFILNESAQHHLEKNGSAHAPCCSSENGRPRR